MLNRLKQKAPTRQEVLPVFSTILFVVFSWMFLQFFLQVPSWIFYMDTGRLLVMFAYVVSYSLLESLLLLGFLIVLCLVLPRRMFKEQFIAIGTVQVLVVSVITLVIRQEIMIFQKFELLKLLSIPIVALAIILLSIYLIGFTFRRYTPLRRLVESFAERMTAFAYLYLPLGLLGTALVIARNIR